MMMGLFYLGMYLVDILISLKIKGEYTFGVDRNFPRYTFALMSLVICLCYFIEYYRMGNHMSILFGLIWSISSILNFKNKQ